MHTVKLLEVKRKEVFYEKLTFIYLEMPKFKKGINELENRFEKWLYVLQNLAKFQERPKILEDRVFKKLFQIAALATLNEKEMYEYEQSLKEYRGMKNVIDTAFQDGFQDGAKDRTISMVKEMVRNGIELAMISKISGLSLSEVKRIAEDLQGSHNP